MDGREGHIRRQRSADTITRRSCFSRLCCCCCNKEDGGMHDLHDDCLDDDMREQESKQRKGEMRDDEMPGTEKKMTLEDRGAKVHLDKTSSEKKKGLDESAREEGWRPSDAEEKQNEENFGAEAKGRCEQEKRRPEEGQMQSHELERRQHDEIMHLKTQMEKMESETNRRNMEQAQKLQQMEDKISSLERQARNKETQHAVEIKRLQKKLVESELMRDINEKFNKSEMSGNIQNTLERDKLIFQVQTYFKDTLCDLTEEDDSVEQETLVKAFVVMYRRAVKKVSDLVSQFAVGHNAGAVAEAIDNIVAQMEAPCPLKEAVSKELKRLHRPPFYTDREESRLMDEEWQLFQNVMFLKSVTVKVTQPQETIKGCLMEVAHETMVKLAEITKSTPSAEVQEGFITASVPVIVSMVLSPNPIIPWISLEKFEAKYVTMDLWEYEEFKDAMKVSKAEGYPIAAFKRPVLLTCTYQSVVVDPGYVRMKLNTAP